MLAFSLIIGWRIIEGTGYEYSEIWSAQIWSAHWFVLALLGLSAFIVILSLARVAGADRLYRRWYPISLSLDDEGLTYAGGFLTSTRRWSWSELSAFEYEDRSFLMRFLLESRVSFLPATPGLMDRADMEPTRSGRKSSIPDSFDASPREICEKLNEYRDRALAGGQ